MAKRRTIRRLRTWPGTLRAAWLMTLVAALEPGSVFSSDDSLSRNATPENPVSVSLAYQETSHSIINESTFITVQTAPFKKEPAAVAGKVFRGSLTFGDNASNAIPFLWQLDAGKLFLDLNRNQDLSDDPAGAFSARPGRSLNSQTFTNAHLLFNTPAGKCPVLADINFWNYGSRPSCSLALRSFWQGKLTLQGQDWQAGVVPNLSGKPGAFEISRLLLRPWEKQNQPLNTDNGSLDSFPFAQKLFVGGHAYQVSWAPGTQNGEIQPALKFTEQSVALGELKVAGKYIQRLTLPDGPYLVVLDQPADTVKVPVGSYGRPNVRLKQGAAEAFYTVAQSGGQRMTVNDQTPAVLNAGGPLTNSVTAARRGRNLQLDYRLVGAGGETYQLANQDRSQPPEFAVYKNDKKVASGKFAYG
jgi:hypothetical protein